MTQIGFGLWALALGFGLSALGFGLLAFGFGLWAWGLGLKFRPSIYSFGLSIAAFLCQAQSQQPRDKIIIPEVSKAQIQVKPRAKPSQAQSQAKPSPKQAEPRAVMLFGSFTLEVMCCWSPRT